MKLMLGIWLVLMVLDSLYAPPVTTPKNAPKEEQNSDIKDNLEEYMEYHRYLNEVVEALESDSDFRAKLEKANDTDIRSGKIAQQLDFVSHNVRTQLDEIKRREMERLRHLATREFELTNNLDTESIKASAAHLDHENPHTFEIEDLRKLIKKTTDDLAEADRKRREEFKEYEMQKEFEKHQKMEAMTEQEKKEFEANIKKEEEEHKHHPKIHNPGSKQQLEEVWEKQDHMDNQEFNPKVFFVMHDLDGNGVWDADEVKVLFIKELDKLYSRTDNHTDLRERYEEMERMREHMFHTSDLNRDGLIDLNEFLLQTKRNDFNSDPEWKGVDENEIYSQKEYEAYERRRLEELKYLQEHGLVDAHGQPIPGAYQHHQQAQYPPIPPQGQHYQAHPNDIPQNYGQQHGQAPYNQGNPPQEHEPQHVNIPQYNDQGQQFHQGPNQGHQNLNQGQQGYIPKGQEHFAPPGQAHYQGQVPPQGQLPLQGQVHPQGQVPQHEQVPQNQVHQQGNIQQQNQLPQEGQIPPHKP